MFSQNMQLRLTAFVTLSQRENLKGKLLALLSQLRLTNIQCKQPLQQLEIKTAQCSPKSIHISSEQNAPSRNTTAIHKKYNCNPELQVTKTFNHSCASIQPRKKQK